MVSYTDFVFGHMCDSGQSYRFCVCQFGHMDRSEQTVSECDSGQCLTKDHSRQPSALRPAERGVVIAII